MAAKKKTVKKQIIEEEVRQLTKAETLYIKEKMNTVSAEKIAEELELDVDLVKSIIPQKARSKFQKDLMSGKSKFGTKVMTPAASEFADEARKVHKKNPKEGSHIYNPYGKDGI